MIHLSSRVPTHPVDHPVDQPVCKALCRPGAIQVHQPASEGDRAVHTVDALGRRRLRGIRSAAAAGIAVAALSGIGGASAGVVAFDAQPQHNSVEWRTFAEASGAVLAAPMEFWAHPDGPLARDWFLCSHGAVIEGICMNEVAFGGGAATGALTEPLSTGEGPLGDTTFIYNAWAGAWEIVVSFRRPVVGVGIMTADHFNPFDVNAMTIEVFDDLHGNGATIGAASSPALNFQLNNRFFIGIVDTEARIRSFRLRCPNVHSDTVFIESIELAVDPAIEHEPLASADLNMDGIIGGADLGILMGAWGTACVTADLDASGVVDGVDMGILLAQWDEDPASGGGGDGEGEERGDSAEPSLDGSSVGVATATGGPAPDGTAAFRGSTALRMSGRRPEPVVTNESGGGATTVAPPSSVAEAPDAVRGAVDPAPSRTPDVAISREDDLRRGVSGRRRTTDDPGAPTASTGGRDVPRR